MAGSQASILPECQVLPPSILCCAACRLQASQLCRAMLEACICPGSQVSSARCMLVTSNAASHLAARRWQAGIMLPFDVATMQHTLRSLYVAGKACSLALLLRTCSLPVL